MTIVLLTLSSHFCLFAGHSPQKHGPLSKLDHAASCLQPGFHFRTFAPGAFAR
ncbi:MAG: hypothetical protein ABSF62_22705 [Bryobacteraceae bacterium]